MGEDPTDALVLPDGIDPAHLIDAVRKSGYPVQTVVARELSDNFTVVEEWGYVDRASQEHRALDIFAHRRLDATSARLEMSLTLLIECKRSDMPYVFFAAAIPHVPSGFPSISGLPKRRFALHDESRHCSTEVPPADFMRCADFTFVSDPAIAVSFSRVERKSKTLCLSGTVPYNTVVLPLASALEHYRDSQSSPSLQQQRFYPALTLCVCVVDAPLVLASGTPEAPRLSTQSWIRLVHNEAVHEDHWWRRKHYVVDVVRRDFLRTYLTDHALPFADQLAVRMTEHEALVVSGKGKVPNWDNWTWNEMRPVE